MYRIQYKYSSQTAEGDPYTFDVTLTLTTKQRTNGNANLSVQVGKTVLKFATKTGETRDANKLRRLVKNVDLRIPSAWRDYSQACDGCSTDMTIEFGFNKLHLYWCSDGPPEWAAAECLAEGIRKIAYKLENSPK
jgi:hypothetical protein